MSKAAYLFLSALLSFGWGVLFVLGVIAGSWALGLLIGTVVLAVLRTLTTLPPAVGSVILLFASVQWSLVVVEVSLRNLMADALYYRAHERLIERWPEDPHLLRYRANASIEQPSVGDLGAMSGQPDWRVHKTIEFETDLAGFRNSNRVDSARSVVVLGDSFAVGSGITQDLAWPEKLGPLLGREVVNLAIPSSPWMSLANFWYESDRIGGFEQADVVLLLFAGNDLDEPYGKRRSFGSGKFTPPWWKKWQIRLENLQRRCALDKLIMMATVADEYGDQVQSVSRGGSSPILFFKPYVERAVRQTSDIENHGNFSDLADILRALANKVRRHGGRLTVVNVPSKVEIYPEFVGREYQPQAFGQVLAPVVAEIGAAWLDIGPALRHEAQRRGASGDLLWWPDDTHWNADGHQLVAQLVAQHLQRLDAESQ
ncbi:MAG: hypothetical protein DHS20C11_10520 [Lysobacteraceae bacterium]|nr:MAG: hypothetical protein DHS20C11_10520 [Xanthomonadaceae bacterium]